MRKSLSFVVFTLLVLTVFLFSEKGEPTASFSPYVDDEGVISVPANFRTEWVFLGTWSVASKENEAIVGEFHNVYTQPGIVETYRKIGNFPDGAVLVKELLKAKTGPMTTGKVSWGAEVTGWFIMVKDRKGRFKDNDLWGDGWGWALFKADNPTKTVTKDYRVDCIPCHLPAKNSDWVYTKGYLSLK